MKTRRRQNLLASVLVCALALATTVARATADPLASWNDGATKKSITDFVAKVTKEGSPDFVPAAERIATFDNDGTLWCEKPMPIQLFFALDRVKELAPQHPEWKDKEPFASLLKGDVKAAMAGGEHALLEIVMATHTGMTVGEFEKMVQDWIATAKHPTTKQPFTKMVYQPMVELLAYLRANGFKTFVFSGGDIAMLRYCQSHPGATLQLMVNHDDAAREFAYAEPDDASLKAAAANGWMVVNMKNDWKQIFAFEK